MSGIGSSVVNCSVDPVNRSFAFYGTCWSRQGISLSLTGHGVAPGDLVVVAYRNGVYVGGISAGSFSGSTSAASGVLDTNTVEMEESLRGFRREDIFDVELQLWNSDPSSLALVARGVLEVKCSGDGYSLATGSTPAVPITGTTGTLGAFGWKDGKIYWRNDEIAGPANWFPLSLQGAAGAMYIDFTQPGVSLT